MALALDEAQIELRGRSLLHPAPKSSPGDELNLWLIADLRMAYRLADLGKPDEAMEALQRNLQLASPVFSLFGSFNNDLAVPNILNPAATFARPNRYYIAWTYLNVAYALVGAGKFDEARDQFNSAQFMAHGDVDASLYVLAQRGFAGMMRLDAAKVDSDKRKDWQSAATARTRLTTDEMAAIDDLLTAQRTRESPTWSAEQLRAFNQDLDELHNLQKNPNWRPGRDFQNDPNYPGNDFTGPDDVHREVLDSPAPQKQ
jgi:tetratricopeptide (TPR) repeat protein